ncbi:hypothetical protein ONZ45_g14801 [Pleurotus djamor]|nr:hypothetical protein ONZ45_g14801 [Pleurotus djamor]
MTRVPTLPPELWTMIMMQLGSPFRNVLHPLLTVSRDIHDIVVPIIYETLVIAYQDEDNLPVKYGVCTHVLPSHLRRLVRSLIRNPALGEHISTFVEDAESPTTLIIKILPYLRHLQRLSLSWTDDNDVVLESIPESAALTHLEIPIGMPMTMTDLLRSRRNSLHFLRFEGHIGDLASFLPPYTTLNNLNTFQIIHARGLDAIFNIAPIQHLSMIDVGAGSFLKPATTLTNLVTLQVHIVYSSQALSSISPHLKSLRLLDFSFTMDGNGEIQIEDLLNVASKALSYIHIGRLDTSIPGLPKAVIQIHELYRQYPSLLAVDVTYRKSMYSADSTSSPTFRIYLHTGTRQPATIWELNSTIHLMLPETDSSVISALDDSLSVEYVHKMHTYAGVIGYAVGTSWSSNSPESANTFNPQYGTPKDFESAIRELREVLPKEGMVSRDEEDLERHGFSLYDYHPGALHSVIVYPLTTEDVVKVVNISRKYKMPVIPYSGGTSLEGHNRGHASGGICVDMSQMDRIIEIHEADSDVVCQPGLRWVDLNETLKKQGIPLFFPLDPAPGATIGGMLSTGCSGTNAVRYGTAKGEWFLNATVVLPSGEVIKTRRRSRKSSAGFDLTKLFIGAEGTLGIVTEVTIRLTPVLPITVAVVHFPDVKKATEAVIDVLNQGVGIQCVELLDDTFMAATNKYGMSTRKWPEKDSLFFKFQGHSPSSLQETARIVKSVVGKYGGYGFTLAKDEEEAEKLWADRKNALFSGLALLEGEDGKGWSTDVCVPVSKLPQLVYETKQDLSEIGLICTIVGHVGDGNFHALLLFKTEEELKIAREAVHRMVERAIALDGTCTGEHGVGIGKKQYLYEELGVGSVELMKTIKRSIDPLGLFNPGKLYPDSPEDSKNGH